MKRRIADEFINLYPVSKTLRFELKPIGRTLEYIERDGIIETDVARSQNYTEVKALIDEYHKAFIQKVLENTELNGLEGYMNLYSNAHRADREEKEFEACQSDLRKQISKSFKQDPAFATIDKKELIKNDLISFYEGDQEKQALIESFSEFTTYFKGFHENRQNMYVDEAKSTSIAYRVVNQNLPKYCDNIKVFQLISETTISVSVAELEEKLNAKYSDFGKIGDYFTIDGFNKVISQKGIDRYNVILGGYTTKDGEKIQGLNEFVNLYNQKYKEHLPKFKLLFKQILSDRDSASFIPDQFESDQQVFEDIEKIYQRIKEELLENEEEITISELFTDLSAYDLGGIYVKNDGSLTAISQELYGDWSVIKSAINSDYENNTPIKRTKREKYEETKKKELEKVKSYSILSLNSFMSNIHKEANVEKYFTNKVTDALDRVAKEYRIFNGIKTEKYENGKSLKSNDSDIAKIKGLLDSLKELQFSVKPLIAGTDEAGKDEVFYGEFLRIWECLDIITPLYSKVRNYVTSKPYSTEKVKLNFGKSTLLDGWDKNKEQDNLGVVFLKDGNYFLGIMNRRDTGCIDSAPIANSDHVYKKMNYKLLPGPNKMFPKVFFSKSRIDEFAPSEELLSNYRKGTYKKGDNFSLEDCHDLIDFFKQSILKHEDWSQFNFKFSDTKDYENISEFYKEVADQGYKINFNDIDESYINKLIDEGSLYLFQIYNKDFSKYSKGMPNLHTLYWKALFMPENLKNVVFKLNGEAEVFFRKASIRQQDIISHAAGQKIKNKDPLNEKTESLFEYDIVKDRRFTCDKFMFHVPITINFKAAGERYMNLRVNNMIHNADEMHIIGIDRGERNLLYICVIDLNGNIVEQMSLNEILSYDKNNNLHRRDYQRMLTEREKENISARQNWTTINTIKELKEGYLSQVIHVITNLMIKYNAIIVLEDLNFGFKRGRQKFERQVYQKFEKMLIDKLNLYVDKQKAVDENGGLLNAYQLTAKFESFQKLGKQSGFLYYVPAWNTSKIDPTTGFTNLFYTRYESVEKTKLFIQNMDRIWYDESTAAYAFSFDYNRFTYKAEGTKTEWTIYTNGRRIERFRNPEKNSEWDVKSVDLTAAFDELMTEYSISKDTEDLRNTILEIKEADFFKRFMKLISLTVQMRNSDEKNGVDEIISPVKNARGEFFVSSGMEKYLPVDADANGAYNIAKKGLWIIQKIKETPEDEMAKLKLTMSNKEWLKFAQENTL